LGFRIAFGLRIVVHRVVKSILVPYSPAEIFDLVNAVERYPEFMPWCGGATVSERSETALRAAIIIDFYGVKQTFATRNTNDRPKRIDVHLDEGPFQHLQGNWQFHALGESACKVVFELEYAFKSRTIELVIGPVFNMIANTFIDAFARRAEAIYGPRP
jgi:ribosome-associated toxin RatA of RatAB toxin-antitoxin module